MNRLAAVLAMLVALALSGSEASGQEGPRSGGVLTWVDHADPGRLDIHTESPGAVQQATAGVFSGLLQVDPGDPTKIAADLAERWQISADGLRYTFHLRRGVRWHDGQPFTAADVKATLDRVLDPAARSPRCGAMLRPLVAKVQIDDPHTVTIALRSPAIPFIASIASAWCRIAAKHILDRYGDLTRPEAQVGTGPFRFVRYERGSLIEWERNKDYFLPGLPYLDGVKQFILVSEPRLSSLWPMTRIEAEELRRARPDLELYEWPTNTIAMVHLNVTRPPFDNPDIRRAAFLAIDRQELLKKALDGSGVACAVLDPKLHGAYALPLSEVEKLPGCRQPKDADLAEARRLVTRHYPRGLDIEVAVRSVGNYVDRVQLILADLRKVDIRGRLRTYESAAGFVAFARGDFDMIGIQDTGMVVTDPSSLFSVLFTTGAGRNWDRWSDPRVDELADLGLRETDPERRIRLYHELQRHLLTRDTAAIPIGWVDGWFFRDRRVQNYRPAATVYDGITFVNVWLKR
jgi:peptide/nickel transport system substrate-binding protein